MRWFFVCLNSASRSWPTSPLCLLGSTPPGLEPPTTLPCAGLFFFKAQTTNRAWKHPPKIRDTGGWAVQLPPDTRPGSWNLETRTFACPKNTALKIDQSAWEGEPAPPAGSEGPLHPGKGACGGGVQAGQGCPWKGPAPCAPGGRRGPGFAARHTWSGVAPSSPWWTPRYPVDACTYRDLN